LYDALLAKVNMPTWFRNLLKELQTFKVKSRSFGLRATISHQLPTGTTSTTPRNTWYNALMFSVSCARQRLRGRALVLGDDLLAVTDRGINVAKWVRTVARFKMILKASTPALDGHATFLSKRIIYSNHTPCMIPKVGKLIARTGARGIHCDAITSSQYAAGKMLSYAYECRHVPFMRDFYLARYSMEDSSRLRLDDLTWSARTAGVSLDNICDIITKEQVLVSDDVFRDWMIDVYDVGLADLGSLCEAVVLSSDLTLVTHPAVGGLSRDW
jgi:hypothetical protein